jgi:phosphatidylinositol glycan class A protein
MVVVCVGTIVFFLLIFTISDLFRALSEAVAIVSKGQHDPVEAHQRVKNFYNWEDVAGRTEVVYDAVVKSEQKDLWTRMQR